MPPPTFCSKNSVLRGLFHSHLWQSLEKLVGSRECVSTGCKPLDEALSTPQRCSTPTSSPHSGIPRGSLIEWLGDGLGNPASVLATVAAREAARAGGVTVFIDRSKTFYPPAAAAWGIDLDRTLIVHPENEKDELWVMDQVMRCAHVAAMVSWPKKLDHLNFRRLQLAGERSGCLGMLIRPLAASREPSWADLRILVSPCGFTLNSRAHWRIDLKVLRCRDNVRQEEIKLEIDDRTGEIYEAHTSHLAAQLAHPKVAVRSGRARA